MGTELKERLSAKQICDRRIQIEGLITQAVELLGEAESLMKTVTIYGLNFDRNTLYSPSDRNQRARTVKKLSDQVNRKFWDHILELGQFRELMSAEKRKEIDNDLENPPVLTYNTLTSTFNDLLSNRVNMLTDLTESVFKQRSSCYKSNLGHKINKRLVFNNVFSKHGGRFQTDLLNDACKVFSVLTGVESPEIVNLLSDSEEPILYFNGAVKFVAYQNGNVHVWILDMEIEYKINNILNKCFDGQLPEIFI